MVLGCSFLKLDKPVSGCQSQVFSGKLKSNGKTFQSNANRRFVDRRFGYIGPGRVPKRTSLNMSRFSRK